MKNKDKKAVLDLLNPVLNAITYMCDASMHIKTKQNKKIKPCSSKPPLDSTQYTI